MIHQGEIYFADLYEAGRRPVLIVSRDSLNRGRYATVVAFTTARLQERGLPNCVFFKAGEYGLTSNCVAQCDTIAGIHIDQLERDAGPIGRLDEPTLCSVINAIGHVIAAECEPA